MVIYKRERRTEMLPESFIGSMKAVLGNDFEKYTESMSEQPVKAIRINTYKTDADSFKKLFPFGIEKIPYGKDEYYVNVQAEDRLGNLPLHHAGAFYSQEPSAMAPADCAPIEKHFKVLDVCASPGGKSAQVLSRIPDGILVSNEIVSSRAVTLMGNIERLGYPNAIVTNTDSETLAKWFPEVFDLVVCDAPCSGEGMFRKNPEAVVEWSPENVLMCAERQKGILENASKTVRCGGYLVYSTCTFSKEENEDVVIGFLDSHPEFTIEKVTGEIEAVTLPGEGIPEARRFYPFSGRGEGQFMALLKKNAGNYDLPLYKDSSVEPGKSDIKTVNDFLADIFETVPDMKIRIVGKTVSFIPDFPVPPHSVFCAGVKIGEIEKGRVVPHHQLFSAFGNLMKRKLVLPPSGEDVCRYIEGNVIKSDAQDGWTAVIVGGCPLGGGKTVGGTLKNHYPKGLRKNIR